MKVHQLHVRGLTAEQLRLLRAAAKKAGQSVSTWVRMLIVERIKQ